MISAYNSRLLSKIKQLAVKNKDYKMIKKIENIRHDYEITKEIKNYK